MMNLRCYGLRIAAVLIVAIGGMALNQAISANQDLRVCHMIATGGTIAMKIDPVKNAPVPALSGEDS
jgi:L-asparaginase